MHVAGIPFLPYPGAAYAAQVLDGSAVPTQTILPGVACNAVTTAAVQTQLQYAQPVSSSYRVAEHSVVDKNTTVASTVPVLSTANNGQSAVLKQPLQSINLTDLLDYSFLMEHGMTESAGTVDLRSPAVLANMLQSLNAASLPSASCTDMRSTETSQPAGQFLAGKQPVQGQQLFQEAINVNQQQVPFSNQQLTAGPLNFYASYGTVTSTAAVLQSSQQKDTVQGSGVVWPWGDQVLISDKPQNEGVVGVVQSPSVATSVSSSSLPVSYEAVSPPSASAENMSFSLLDNLQLTGDAAGACQLSSFLGSTVDTSALFAAAPYGLASASQHSRVDTLTVPVVTSMSFSASASDRSQSSIGLNDRSSLSIPLETTLGRQSIVELEKAQKQKSNLGIVLPMTHGNHDERNSIISEVASSCRTSMSADTQSVAESHSQYLASTQLSADKSTAPVTDTAAGGIVLTNITGNVYVNQYTMLPGGAQALDNALLHADLGVGGAAGSLSYDSAIDETAYSLAAPSVAVVLNNTEDELNSFAAEPLISVSNVEQQPRILPHSAPPTARQSAELESSFFGAEAAPVLAAKPSNKFESSFLQFICGHKAETLSSVLNSPIKTRPVLPKYIPEPRRPKAAELTVVESENKMEASDEQSSVTTDTDKPSESATESAAVSNVS